MKKHLLLFLAIFCLSMVVGGQQRSRSTAAQKQDPAKAVRAAFELLLDGIREANVDKVMSVYEKSDRTLFFNNNGSVTIGWETMRSNREQSYEKTKDVKLEVTGVRIELLGPRAAYVSCKWKQSQVYDEKPESSSGRMTLIFKQIGGEWKIVHLHTSPDNVPAERPLLESERPRISNTDNNR